MLTPPLVLAHFWGLKGQIQIGESLNDTPKVQHLLYWGTDHIIPAGSWHHNRRCNRNSVAPVLTALKQGRGHFCHTGYLPKNGIYNQDIFTIFGLNHINTWDQQEIESFLIRSSNKYEKYFMKLGIQKMRTFFSPRGHFCHTTFSPSFDRKTVLMFTLFVY